MIKQKFLIDFGAKLAVALFTAATGIIVARMAGPVVVGIIGYATAFVSIFSFITGLFGTAHIKLVSEGENEEDCFKTYLTLFIVSSVIFVIAVIGYLFFLIQYQGHKFDSPQTLNVIFITLGAAVISNFFVFNQTVFAAKTEQVKSNLPDLFRSFLFNILRIFVVIMGLGAIALSFVNLISSLILLPLVFIFLRKNHIGRFNRGLAKKYFTISIPLLLIVIINSIMMYSDRLVLEYYTNEREIGLYSAAYSIGGILILFGNTAGTIFFPLFSTQFAKGNIEYIKKKIFRFERFIFSFLLPFIVSLSLFSYPVLITLLSTKYEQSVPLFSMLVFSSFFVIMSMPYGNVISASGMFWVSSIINFIKFIIFIGVLIFTIHPSLLNLGGLSLAITQLVISIFMFLAYYIISWRRTGILFIRHQFKNLIFWSGLYGITTLFIMPHITGYSLILQTFIFLPVYILFAYLLMFIFGLIKKSDFILLTQLLNPKQNIRYVKQEIKGNLPDGTPPGIS